MGADFYSGSDDEGQNNDESGMSEWDVPLEDENEYRKDSAEIDHDDPINQG